MIFVTVGTDQHFDRLLKVIDCWARESNRRDVFAQIGIGAWQPEFIGFTDFLQPQEFKRYFDEAELIISHAGMGTIITALHQGKPILVMPKRASLGEHRNEHQLATTRRMMKTGGVNVAFDEQDLREKLDRLDELASSCRIGTFASESLVSRIRDFIFSGKR